MPNLSSMTNLVSPLPTTPVAMGHPFARALLYFMCL